MFKRLALDEVSNPDSVQEVASSRYITHAELLSYAQQTAEQDDFFAALEAVADNLGLDPFTSPEEETAMQSMVANELFHTTPDQLPPSPNRKMRTLPDKDTTGDPDLRMD